MKKFFALLNALLILAVLVGDAAYIDRGTLLVKSVTSLLFTAVAAVNLVYAFISRSEKGYPAVMLAGLTFAMLGDIELHYDFIYGAGLFALGHVLYFVSFCLLLRFKPKDLIPAALVFAGSAIFLLYYKGFYFGRALMKNVCLAYAAIISLMVGKSISNFLRKPCFLLAVAAIGSIMFFVSDFMLVLHRFARMPRIVGTLCLVFYYPAQCVLGFSSFLYSNRAAKD